MVQLGVEALPEALELVRDAPALGHGLEPRDDLRAPLGTERLERLVEALLHAQIARSEEEKEHELAFPDELGIVLHGAVASVPLPGHEPEERAAGHRDLVDLGEKVGEPALVERELLRGPDEDRDDGGFLCHGTSLLAAWADTATTRGQEHPGPHRVLDSIVRVTGTKWGRAPRYT